MTEHNPARAPEFYKAREMNLNSLATILAQSIDITNGNNKTSEILQIKKDQNSSSKITANVI